MKLVAGPTITAKTEAEKIAAQKIAQLVEEKYFQGVYQGDLQLLQEIFHEQTLLFGDVRSQPYAKTLHQYLNGVAQRISPKDSGKRFEAEIIEIDVVNSIAVAKVRLAMYDFNYHDFLSFHKINEKWMIVHKLLTHVEE